MRPQAHFSNSFFVRSSRSKKSRAAATSLGVPWTSNWAAPPKASFSRVSMREMARWVTSMPIQRRFSFCAAWTVVPQPQNGSSTVSPSLEEAEMMRSRRATGFWVG